MSDFSAISGISMSDYVNQAKDSQSTSALKGTLSKDFSTASEAELMEACKSFESYFLEQIFKAMMKTVPTDDSTSNYTSSIMDYYKDEMVKTLAEQSTNQNSLGLAKMLYEQMKRNMDTADISELAGNTGVSVEM